MKTKSEKVREREKLRALEAEFFYFLFFEKRSGINYTVFDYIYEAWITALLSINCHNFILQKNFKITPIIPNKTLYLK